MASRAVFFLWLLGQTAVSLVSASGQSPPPADTTLRGAPREIEGEWKGVYFQYPELLVLRLTIRSGPMDSIEGDGQISPAVPPNCRGCGTNRSYHFKGHYTPWSKGFSTDREVQPISGVVDVKGERIVGYMADASPVVLARGPAGDALVNDVVASAYAPLGRGVRSIPDTQKLTQWIAHFGEEYPALDVGRTQFQILWRSLQNLFADDSFRPIFGTTFEHLEIAQRKELVGLFQRARRSELIGKFNFLASAFDTNRSNASDYVSVWVFWQRAMRSWMNERMEWCALLPPELESFHLMKSVESLGLTQLSSLWPSELEKFKNAVGQTRSRLAPVILERGVDQALASANSAEGARKLAGWLDEPAQKEIAPYVPGEVKNRLKARLETRVGELIAASLQEQERLLSGLGDGKDAVLAGNKWYGDLTKQFGFASDRPAFQQILQKLQARRPADLKAAGPAIGAELTAQTTLGSLDSKLKEYLRVPGDEATPAAAELRQVAQKVRTEIKANEYLTFFSPNEKRWNPQRDGSITVPAVVPPPNADDIRVAYARTYEMMGGERVSPFSFQWGGNPLLSAFGLHVTTVVQPVQSVSCAPENGGYKCDFRLALKVQDEGLLADRGSGIGNTMQQFFNAVANGPVRERFELGSRGWWSPSLRERILEQMSR